MGPTPVIYKWSKIKRPYNWPYTWVSEVITRLIGVITPFLTKRSSSCRSCHWFLSQDYLASPFKAGLFNLRMEKSTWGISRLVTCFWQVMAEHRWKLAYDQFQVRLSNFTTVSDGPIIEHSQESSLPGGRIYISWRTTCRSYGNKLWNGSASWGRCNIFESVGLQQQNSWWNIALWIDVWGLPGLVIRFTHKPFRPRLR